MNQTDSPSLPNPRDASRSENREELWRVLIVYAILLLVIFGRCLFYPLLDWDDQQHLSQNPSLNPVSWSGLKTIWTQPYEGLYIPLSYTFFALETTLTRLFPQPANGELAPWLFHSGSLLLHLLNSVLIYRILNLTISDSRAAFLGGLLFLLHPLQVESVVWISETRGLLSSFFAIAMIYLTLKYVKQSDQSSAEPVSVSLFPLITATACLELSLLAKPASVTAPLMIAVLVWGFFPQQLKPLVKWIVCWLIMAGGMILVNRGEQDTLLFDSPLWARPLLAGDALAFYLTKLVAPFPLMMQYDQSIKLLFDSRSIYWYWLIPALLFLIVLWLPRRRTWLTALGLFVVALLPVSGLIPFAYQYISIVADRYVYLALLGPALALACLLHGASSSPFRLGAFATIAILGGISFFQTGVWADSQTLYRQCLHWNPRAFIALNNLGHLAFENNQLETALNYFQKAIAIMPDRADTSLNLAATLQQLGETNAAVPYYERVLELEPENPRAHLALGVHAESQQQFQSAQEHYLQTLMAQPENEQALLGLGNLERQARHFETAENFYLRALQFSGQAPEIHQALGMLYLETDQIQQAQQQFEAARQLGSTDPAQEFNLGLMAARNQNWTQAIQHYEIALKQATAHTDPELHQKLSQELAIARNLQGTFLQEQGAHTQAIPQFEAAIKAAPDLAPAYFNLSESLYQLKQKQAAIAALQQALRLVPAGSEPSRDIQHRIDLYQK